MSHISADFLLSRGAPPSLVSSTSLWLWFADTVVLCVIKFDTLQNTGRSKVVLPCGERRIKTDLRGNCAFTRGSVVGSWLSRSWIICVCVCRWTEGRQRTQMDR